MKDNNTIIGQSVKITGDFIGDGDIIIEGIVEGSIHTNGNVEIADSAEINASVTCGNATISGKLRGNIIIKESLKVNGTAIITGDIKTTNISVEQGALINGKIETGGIQYSDK